MSTPFLPNVRIAKYSLRINITLTLHEFVTLIHSMSRTTKRQVKWTSVLQFLRYQVSI